VNAELFDQNLSVGQISDGTSNTVMTAEGWGYCYNYNGASRFSYMSYYYPSYSYSYNITYTYTGSYYKSLGYTTQTYAYSYGYTYMPKFNKGNLFQTNLGYVYGGQCDGSTAQAFSTGVLLAGLADGSVRGLNSSMSVSTWNGALTPNGGEVLGSDW
jgi:hypothetical protein